jgi:hypothetical protein
VHRCGDEAAWWRKAGIDPLVTARTLWLEAHPLGTADLMDRRSLTHARAGNQRHGHETKPN